MNPQTIKHLLLFPLLLLLAVSVAYSQNPAFDALADEITRTAIYKKTKSFELLDSLYQMAYNEPDSSLRIARCLYEESNLNYRQRIVDTLLADRIKSRLARENTSLYEQALLQSALGIELNSRGEYSEAFTVHLQALEKFKQLNNKFFIARTLNRLGVICHNISLLNLANYYYSEALKSLPPEHYEYLPIKMNIFQTRFNEDATIVDSLLCFIEMAEKENKEEILPLLYFTAGVMLFADPEKALMYFTKTETLDFDLPDMTATLYANMGLHYLRQNDTSQALNCLQDAQKIMEENRYNTYLPVVYDRMSSIFEQQNMLDSALAYARKSQEATFQLHSNTVAVETHQKLITNYLETAQKDLIIAEQKIALKHRQLTIIIIVSASAVLLLWLFVNQQKRRKASENRELTAKLEYEKLEKEKQEAISDAKTRELTSFSVLVANKNQLLRQIKGQIEKIRYSGEDAVDIAAKTDEIIQNNLNVDEEWANFKMHFDKVHPHFFEKLTQACSALTEENLKMCAYFKIGMTTKQIAQLLHVIPRSVIINRYRLKKKLQLPDEQDLDDFIRNL